ncbi:hypothetical protein [Syntrophomonas wolfei]|uniref:hypothetical protein n=1 Tax=Syntrophomonas wolfei TaxID=863 RepID=UPI000A94F97E|nr:hypothetical protein [Syntrophomonas wolfei]
MHEEALYCFIAACSLRLNRRYEYGMGDAGTGRRIDLAAPLALKLLIKEQIFREVLY